MQDFEIVLFIIAILAICFVLYLLYKIGVYLGRRSRLDDFGIDIKGQDIDVSFRYKFLYKVANFLESLVIFNVMARTYDKYITEDSKLRKGMDYIAIKLCLGIIFTLIYIFMSMISIKTINPYIAIICFILGYIITDFYCYFKQYHRQSIEMKDLLSAIIIMRNSYKANRSTDEMLDDLVNRTNGRVKEELRKVKGDMKVGLSISEAFKRMYERTNLSIILDIANILSLTNKTSVNMIQALDTIEKKVIDYEKVNDEINLYKSINKLSYVIFLLLPFIFLIFIIISNQTYLSIIGGSSGSAIILTLTIIYIIYILIINKIVKGRYLWERWRKDYNEN